MHRFVNLSEFGLQIGIVGVLCGRAFDLCAIDRQIAATLMQLHQVSYGIRSRQTGFELFDRRVDAILGGIHRAQTIVRFAIARKVVQDLLVELLGARRIAGAEVKVTKEALRIDVVADG